MLSGDYLQSLVGAVLAPIYEPGQLEIWQASASRDPATGTFPMVRTAVHVVRVQVDRCTESMRQSPLYTGRDVRLLVLQSGVGAVPDTDSRIIVRGQSHRILSVGQDPARAYWDLHAVAV